MTKNNLAKLVLGAALTVGMATAVNAADSKCGAGKCGGKKVKQVAKCGSSDDDEKATAKCGSKKVKQYKCGSGDDGDGGRATAKCGGKK